MSFPVSRQAGQADRDGHDERDHDISEQDHDRGVDELAGAVVKALKQLQPTDPAAKNAKVVGWVDALDYAPVEALQKTLKVGAFLAAN